MATTGSIYIAATLDTKGDEAIYIKRLIQALDLPVVLVDLSTQPCSSSKADVEATHVAAHHPQGAEVVLCGQRGNAIEAMAVAFEHYIATRQDVAGLLGIGGSGGTALITPAMRSLPIGVPKVMISTMASGDVSAYMGASDIAMVYSVTDVAGINRISRQVLANGAHMMAGAVKWALSPNHDALKPAIALTMFGVTTPCIQATTEALQNRFDCLVFHATGSGGRAMEKLVDSHFLDGVLDITTTEVCDLLFGGVLACGPDRLDAIARTRLPYVGSCGALDMVNFAHVDSIPAHYRSRLFYKHNPQVTLMRTTVEENRQLGQWIGNKLNACEGQVRFLIPEGGFSALDTPGGAFWDPAANQAFVEALETTLVQTPHRRLIKLPHHINDPAFAAAASQQFLLLVDETKINV